VSWIERHGDRGEEAGRRTGREREREREPEMKSYGDDCPDEVDDCSRVNCRRDQTDLLIGLRARVCARDSRKRLQN